MISQLLHSLRFYRLRQILIRSLADMMTNRVTVKRVVFGAIALTCFLFVLINNFWSTDITELKYAYSKYEKFFTEDGYCNFYIDPYDPKIANYISEPLAALKCRPKQSNLTFIDKTRLKLVDPSTKGCSYRYIFHNSGVDDFTVAYSDWKVLEGTGVELEHDFVDVKCIKFGFELYRKQLATVITRKESIENKGEFIDESKEHPSVIIIGFDGLSRSNYIRQMKKSKKQMDKMGFVLFDKYAKIADNTFPNWVGIFMGQHSYYYEFNGTVDVNDHIDYDNWTELAWRRFGAEGYATLFAEDSPDTGTFHYDRRRNGFIARPPTDHYLRTLYLSWQDQKYLQMRSDLHCYDGDPAHNIQFDYLEKFFEAYQGKAKFAFSWMVDISHDYLGTISIADDDFVAFLERNEKHFDNSVVIVLSDHGNRYDKIRSTVVGRMESRLPVFSIRIPESLRQKYPQFQENLTTNQGILATHFDTHALLMHILGGLDKKPPTMPRGQSLFTKINSNRTCHDAEIPQVFCPCFKEIVLDPSEGVEYANILLDYVKDYFKKNSVQEKCAPLKLEKVTSLILTMPPEKMTTIESEPALTSAVFNYRVQFMVDSPSNALLEGTVFKNHLTGKTTFSQDLDRNNKYGNTSHCVDDALLKKLCHCL